MAEWEKERPNKATGATHPRETWDLEIHCPRDGARMVHLNYRGVSLDSCPTCGLVWMDGDEIAKALNLSGGSKENKQGSAWSEADFLGPFIYAALEAVFSGA